MKKGNTRQKHALKKRESRKKCQQWQYASLCWRSCISLLGLCFIHRHRSSILCHTSIMSAKRTRVPHIMHWHFDSLTRIRLSSPLVCFDWIFFSFLSALVLLLLLFWSGFCRSFNWKRWLDVLHLDTTVHVSYSILSIKQSAKSNQIVFCEVYSSRSSPWNVNTIPIFAFGCLGRVLLTILWNMLNAFCMNSMKSLGLKVDSFTFHWKCEIQHQ